MIRGIFADGALQLLMSVSGTVFTQMSKLKLWGADFTPVPGWTTADLGSQQFVTPINPWSWNAAAAWDLGISYRKTSVAIEWDTSELTDPIVVYGISFGSSVAFSSQLWAGRFPAAPLTINPGDPFSVWPYIFFRDPDTVQPTPP